MSTLSNAQLAMSRSCKISALLLIAFLGKETENQAASLGGLL
jgi:ABC-type microcin C transport system permease subunit YejE